MTPRRRRRRRGRRSIGLGGFVLFLAAALAATAAVWWLWQGGADGPLARALGAPPAASGAEAPAAQAAAPPPPSEPEPGSAIDEPAPAPSPEPPSPAPPGGASIALVIDDLGRSLDEVRDLAALGVPLTYAVLPFETRTAEVAAALAEGRAEVLLHLPMEGRGSADPGPGALFAAMSREELASGTRRALAAVPGAVGVNNHMGSVLTADRAAMHRVLGELGGRGLFFLDSRTSADSVAFAVARDLGLPAAERHVFLDPDPAPEAIRAQFRRLLALAADRGTAIAIGHPYPSTRAVLAEEIPLAQRLGYRVVPLSELVERAPAVRAALGD
jgi:polysaccharide deacetylase 2 family uncharacterized protein YibQ